MGGRSGEVEGRSRVEAGRQAGEAVTGYGREAIKIIGEERFI